MLYGSLIAGASALFGVILGYEIGRAARFGKPLFCLPKRKKKAKQEERQYTL